MRKSEGKISRFGVKASEFGIKNRDLQSKKSEFGKKYGVGFQKGGFGNKIRRQGKNTGMGNEKGEIWGQ